MTNGTVPAETVGGPYVFNENAASVLSGLSVSASPNADDPLSVVLSVAHGTVTAGGQSGASITLIGTAAQVDSALISATYAGALNFYGSDTLSMVTTDTADNAQAVSSGGITILDTSVPSETVASAYSDTENAAIALSGLSVSVGPNAGDRLSVVLSVAHGTLSAGGQSGASVTLSGTTAQINSVLAGATYTDGPNYSGSDTLSVTATDIVDKTQAFASAGITIAAGGPYLASEDAPISLGGLTVTGGPNAGASDVLSTVLSVGYGTIAVGNQTGASVTLTGTADQINAALAGATYSAAMNYLGPDTLSLTTSDTANQNQTSTTAQISDETGLQLATQIVESVSTQPFALPAYTGSTSDLGYLRQWVLNQVTAIYGVSADIFDTPTVLSTSILRDFVHRALEETTAPDRAASTFSNFAGWNDVALEFRYPAHGLCGEMAWQMWEVFRAFGFQTNDIGTINGPVDSYTDGHATTQVYVDDLGKYIIQDSTFNFLYQDTSGNILSFYEAQQANHAGTLVFNGFPDYRSYNTTGTSTPEIPTWLQQYFEANYLKSVYDWFDSFGNETDMLSSIFVNPASAHNAANPQGGEFANGADAWNAVSALQQQGLGWMDVATALRGQGYYVSGFALTDSSGDQTSQWLTFQLTTGAYVSLSMQGASLNGSLDQLQNESGGGTVLNPGVDLSAFLAPLYVLGASGTLMSAGVPLKIIAGTTAPSTLVAVAGIDCELVGLSGNDILDGRNGAPDLLIGAAGTNTYYVDNSVSVIDQAPGGGLSTVYAYCNYTMPANVQVMYLKGTATTATISSGTGTIYGNNNNDLFYTLGAVAHVYGGTGRNNYYVDNPNTIITQQAGSTNTVFTWCNYTMPANVQVMNLMGTATTATLTGGLGWIYGNNNNDFFYTQGALAHLYGGTGNNNYYIDNPSTTIVQQAGGINTVYAYCNYTMPANVQIMNLKGAATTATIKSGIGWLYGNANNDKFYTQGALAHIYGGTGNNTYYLDNPSTTISQPASGNNTVYAYCNYTLPANVQTMYLMGLATTATIGSGTGTIYGNNNNDIFYTQGALAQLYAGTGSNTYYLDNPNTTIAQQAGGNNTVYAYCNYTLPANVQTMYLMGLATTATIGSGAGTIYGNNNADIFYTQGALAHLYGGTGSSTYYLDNPNTTISQQAGGSNTIYAYCNYTLPANVQTMYLMGSATIGRIAGGTGTIYGNNNNDVFYTQGATGHLFGGTGNNTYYLDNAGTTITQQAGGIDTIYAYCDYTLPANVQILNMEGAATRGSGHSGIVYITGNNNNDVIDTRGALGHIWGGTGSNNYYIDNSSTTIIQQAGGINTVYAWCDYALPANVQILNMEGAATHGSGHSGTVYITGNSNNDIIDTRGALGHLYGGTGNNTYYIDNQSTTLIQQAGGTNTINAWCNYTLPTNCQVLNLQGTANIYGKGNSVADMIAGNSGNNLLSGGGAGTQFTGGGGNDTFALTAGQANGDTIFDFDSIAGETDLLKLTGYGTAQQGANIAQVGGDATHWQINSANGLIHDTITLANSHALLAGDYQFS